MDRYCKTLIIALGVAVLAPPPTVAWAQFRRAPKPVERYERASKGANMAAWIKRLASPEVKVRLEAVESIGQSGGDESIKPLLSAMADADHRVRLKAIDHLGRIGSRLATTTLVQSLFLRHVDLPSKERIIVALGRIRDPSSARALSDFALRTDATGLRSAAIYSLGETGGPDFLQVLEKLRSASDDPGLRRLATDAMAKIETRAARKPQIQPSIIELEKRMRPPAKR
ncbi:MAG: HEAT repeat domain-containing protein [Deltaproteobacteria bacterium]